MAIIDKPSDYFETILYTGNGSSQNIGGLDFQPDWVWIKSRSLTKDHDLYDSVRGADKPLESNTNVVEQDAGGQGLTSFRSDGFAIGNRSTINSNSATQVSWNWLAGGTGSSNTDGSISSTVSANTTSGFSIVSYTGNGSSGSTIGHGLNAVPEVVLIRRRNQSTDWNFQLGYSQYLKLNSTDQAIATSGGLVGSGSTSTITVDANAYVNASGDTYIAYCFAGKKGFSKFGSYTGNGSTDGTFVYTGFKPAFLIVRNADATADWVMNDNKRNTFNPNSNMLFANTSGDENTGTARSDFLSNGFKIRSSNSDWNGNGNKMLYMAFAENPFVTSTGIPTTAR